MCNPIAKIVENVPQILRPYTFGSQIDAGAAN
jgi:hypothetical protein